MQKALTQMNIQLANVLSDVSGVTGQAIIKAILAGERDPHKLAAFRDPHVKAAKSRSRRSGRQLANRSAVSCCSRNRMVTSFASSRWPMRRRLKQYLQQREDRSQGACLPEESGRNGSRRRRAMRRSSTCALDLFRMTGTDLTQIDGIDVMTATTILSEAGWDMSKWETERPFCFLATAMSGQPHQRRQDHWERPATDE